MEWGIFDEVVESDELTEHVQDTGQRLLKQGLTNLAIAKSGITKSVVNQVVGGLEQALMLAVYAQAQVIDQQGTTWRQKGAVDPKAAG